MLKMDPEAKLPWAIKMVNLTENVKNLNEDESAEPGFQIRVNWGPKESSDPWLISIENLL